VDMMKKNLTGALQQQQQQQQHWFVCCTCWHGMLLHCQLCRLHALRLFACQQLRL
jgi:hypothetical protein